jgi:hypothetical protein
MQVTYAIGLLFSQRLILIFIQTALSKSGSNDEPVKPFVNRRTAQRVIVAAAKSIAIIKDVPVPVFRCNSEDDAQTADDNEASGNVSTVVLVSSNIWFFNSIHRSHSALQPYRSRDAYHPR